MVHAVFCSVLRYYQMQVSSRSATISYQVSFICLFFFFCVSYFASFFQNSTLVSERSRWKWVHSQYLSRAFSYMESVFSVLVFVLLCFYVFGYVFFLFILHVLVLVRLTALRVTSLPLCFYPEAFRTVFLYFFLGLKARGSLAPRI